MPALFRNSGRAFTLAASAILLLAGRSAAAPVPAGADLSFVPADAVGVVSIHLGDLWKHPIGKAVLRKVTEGLPDAVKAIRGEFGLSFEDMERATLFWPALEREPTGRDSQPIIAVATPRPYDQKAILAAAAPTAKSHTVNGRIIYINDRMPSFLFTDEHTYLMGLPELLEAYLKRKEGQTERPLAAVLKLADKHLIVAGMDVASVVKARPVGNNVLDQAKPFLPLTKARLVTLTVDLDHELRAHVEATFPTEGDASDGAAAADAALDEFRKEFAQGVKDQLRPADLSKLIEVLNEVNKGMRSAKAERKGEMVEASAAAPLEIEATTAAVGQFVEVKRKAMEQAKRAGPLRELLIAAQTYQDVNGFFPLAAITDKKGKALLSWRVMLLPYLDQGKLYSEFHLDEPWDSDHNKKLLEKMPAVFAPADSPAFKDHETHYQALVGKGTMFDGTKVTFPQITDGTSNTILFVEAKKAVPWTKPEDLPIHSDKIMSKLGGRVEGKFMAAMCDGSVRFFPLTMKEETLRIWAGRNNGQVRPEPEK